MSGTATTLEWWEGLRLTLHVIAACVWVGGQFALAGLVPVLRTHSRETLPLVARAFAKIAWPAYVVLIATGVWNLWSIDTADASASYLLVVFLKVVFVAVAGLATLAHSTTQKVWVRAFGGALSMVASIVSVYFGVLLTLA